MRGAFVYVTRPEGPRIVGLRIVLALLTFVFLLVAGVSRLAFNVGESMDVGIWVVRGGFVLAVLYLSRWAHFVAYGVNPTSPVLIGRRLYVTVAGSRQRFDANRIRKVEIERRGSGGETFVLQFDGGSEVDLCPVSWKGAGDMYAAVQRRIARNEHRRTLRPDSPTGESDAAAVEE